MNRPTRKETPLEFKDYILETYSAGHWEVIRNFILNGEEVNRESELELLLRTRLSCLAPNEQLDAPDDLDQDEQISFYEGGLESEEQMVNDAIDTLWSDPSSIESF